MKKFSFFLYIMLAFALYFPVSAQISVNMANSGATPGGPFTIMPASNCSFLFYDSGGPTGNYNLDADAHITFYPSNPATHRIQITFLAFGLEANWDALYIYNGTSILNNQLTGPQGATNGGFPAGNWQTISPGTITANTGIAAVGANPAEALTIRFRSDPSIPLPGWQAIVREVPISACTMTAPPNLTGNTGPSATTCFANVVTPLPTFSPGGCATGNILQYRINGGLPNIVTVAGFTTIAAPKGVNQITWELISPCGGGIITTANQQITVSDNTPPTLICPANQTIALSPGNCTAQYNYTVQAADNCGFPTIYQVTQPIDFDNGGPGIMFNLINLSPYPITLDKFGPSLDAGSWPIEVYYTNPSSTWSGNQNNAQAWSLAGKQTVTSTGPSAGTAINGFGLTLASGQSIGIYLTSNTGSPFNYTNTSRQNDDGALRISSSPGAGVAYPFGTASANGAYNGYVSYTKTVGTNPVQLGGIASNGSFPKGTTLNTFQVTDLSGNTATCSFNVTVVNFPNAINSLTCNDLVVIALGENCQTVIGSDQVLEGGPYKCYDEYVVELDKISPFGNGPWVPGVVSSADINKTYRVRVTDPTTNNQCTGDVKIQDNLPPKLVCQNDPVIVPCSYPTDPGYSLASSAEIKRSASGLPQNLVDFQTRTFEIPYVLPAGAIVNDVDLRVKVSGEAFYGNLRIEVESPAATTVVAWNQVTGCGPSPVFVRLDDEGSANLGCLNYTTDKKAVIPNGAGTFSSFDNQNANGIWRVRISDINGGNDLSTIEAVDLFVKVNATFGVSFPNNLTSPPITKLNNNTYNVPAGLMDNCSNVTLTYSDMVTPQACNTGLVSIINRLWIAKDASGNTASCTQVIQRVRQTLSDLTLPPHYDGVVNPSFNCTQDYPTPQWIQNNGGIGFPSISGQPVSAGTGCNITHEFDDEAIWTCDGSYVINRKWTFIDACTGEIQYYNQIIRVDDKQGPVFVNCPVDYYINTDQQACCGSTNLPDVIVRDACSKISTMSAIIRTIDPYTQNIVNTQVLNGSLSNFPGNNLTDKDTMVVFGLTPCLPIGRHEVEYIITDNCGNSSSCLFHITVKDFSPPIASCDETTVVALGFDDPDDCYYPNANTCEFAGVATIPAFNLDDGSYDNCAPLKFTARRVTPYSTCITSMNACEYQTATQEADSIKFYCCEAGTTQMVILRVYQLEPDGTISTYPDGTQIYNECQIQVEVQDKLKPVCEPPLNVTVNCESFDPSLWSYGTPVIYDNCCLDATKVTNGVKGMTQSVNYAQFDTVCNRGTIFRTFRAWDCKGFTNQCTQRIIVNYNQNYAVKFPDDKLLTECNAEGTSFGQPEFYGEDCELMAVSYEDLIFTVVPDACFKIERTWTIINWCSYIPEAGLTEVPNPTPNANLNSPQNMTGPIVSAQGTPAPWAPTVSKILPTSTAATNYSQYWSANSNGYRYKQIIKVQDQQAPVIQCPASPVEFCDLTTNDPKLWNDPSWYNPIDQQHDLCEGIADLTITATDYCSGPNISIRYLLFLDLDGNGTMETVINSVNPPAAGVVNYNNVANPNFSGGIAIPFDQRNVPNNQKYQFGLQTSILGTNLIGSVRWNTPQSPGVYAVPELPYGRHKIKWIVSDGCGNEKVCEYEFIIKDCKAPTVVCINGLSANNMATGMITLFASDFLINAEDNCTLVSKLRFGIRKSGTGSGFPFDANGNPVMSVTFTCAELGTQFIELWAIDEAGNADYCETYVIVQDNAGNCPSNGSLSVAGALVTEMGEGLEEAGVEFSCSHPALPPASMFTLTDVDGDYLFNNAVPLAANYTVTPIEDENPLNGVSTLDLVLISKHILGIEPLSSPYKMIAADANKSGSITTFDIVELRKLILGIYDELPNNNSWVFVDKNFTFPNPNNPFATAVPENISKANAQLSNTATHFTAIKVGDVNSSAMANAMMQTDDRSAGVMLFDVYADNAKDAGSIEAVKAGDVFKVGFNATETIQAFQMTLNLKGLKVVDVVEADGVTANNFGIFENALTVSIDGGTRSFFVKFRATESGKLSDMISVSSRITKAEAYSAKENKSIALRFNGQNGPVVTGIGFELYQNIPNPFVQKTQIGFYLPEASNATLRITDETGREVHTQKGQFAKGYNSFTVDRTQAPLGMLYYTVETPSNVASKSMIQVK